ncbi:hypothetical protein LOD99_2956 [Oopsacas minuta]|uniref:Uncharacterized protein n=1 Tax=Oopsacas minuta TaxID=111878 RepID=A0AAV7K028_9METZ|nr:hypothetical protein LOD99_2956 [Oopsacas minuta]
MYNQFDIAYEVYATLKLVMDLSYGLFFPPSVENLSSLRPYQLPKTTSYVFLYAIDPAQLSEAEARYNKFITDKVTKKPDYKIKVSGQIKETDDASTFAQGQYQLPSERNSAGSDESFEAGSDDSGQNMMEMTLSD